MVFNVIPGVASCYFLIALFILDFLLRTRPAKTSERDNQNRPLPSLQSPTKGVKP